LKILAVLPTPLANVTSITEFDKATNLFVSRIEKKGGSNKTRHACQNGIPAASL